MTGHPVYHAYVDEAGDRGWHTGSSCFVLAAAVTSSENDAEPRTTLNSINDSLGRPSQHVLHSSENLRRHDDRKMIASRLGEAPMTALYVVLEKDATAGRPTPLRDPVVQYTYLVSLVLERLARLAAEREPQARVRVHLAHVRRFKYERLSAHLLALRRRPIANEWGRLYLPPRIAAPSQTRGLQVADVLAGCAYQALQPDRHGDLEPEYLRRVAPRLWLDDKGQLDGFGITCVGPQRNATDLPWFEDVQERATRTQQRPVGEAGPTTAANSAGVTPSVTAG